MRIKSFTELFETQQIITNEEIDYICKQYNIKNYTIRPDGKVDVNGDVDLPMKGISKIPIPFGKVSNSFYCNNNKLTSLEGAPESVGRHFICHHNQLTSLEGAPKIVGGDFNCFNNKLTSLEGAPKIVGEDFYCKNNKLTSLEGSPERVVGDFFCNDNPLESLEGAPKIIDGEFLYQGIEIKAGKFTLDGIFDYISTCENDGTREFLLTIFTDAELDAHMEENPMDLYLLDAFPDKKADVIRRTGIKDWSRLGKLQKSGLI